MIFSFEKSNRLEIKNPKNPPYNNTNISLLRKFKATKIPKKKDDKKFTIEVF